MAHSSRRKACIMKPLAWLGYVCCVAYVVFFGCFPGCVIDPLLLTPQSGPTDAAGPELVTDTRKACYDACLEKLGSDTKAADSCAKTCDFKPDPTLDCYDPCIQAGSSGSVCGKKCYNTSNFSEKDECYLACFKSGLDEAACDEKLKVFLVCFAPQQDRTCLSSCSLDTFSLCYDPCVTKGIAAVACKERVLTFQNCVKSGKGVASCQNVCVQ